MASSRARYAITRGLDPAQPAAQPTPSGPQARAARRPVVTRAARPVSVLAETFEAGASTRILSRRSSCASVDDGADPALSSSTTPATTSTSSPSTSSAASSTVAAPTDVAPAAAAPADAAPAVVAPTDAAPAVPASASRVQVQSARKTTASRVMAYQSSAKYLAQCAANKARKEQLAARQQQEADLRNKNRQAETKIKAKANAVPRRTSTRNVAGRATKYATSAKYQADAAANIERRRELEARQEHDAAIRWKSANAIDADADTDRDYHHQREDSVAPTPSISAQQLTPPTNDDSVVRQVREQQAEGRERRRDRLAARHPHEETIRWHRANGHRSGDDYVPPASTSLLAWESVEGAAAALQRYQRPRPC